jgi:hypothetical protein
MLAGGAVAHAERVHQYTVSVDAELTRISVRACFDGKPPIQLTAESLDAASVLLEAHLEAPRTSRRRASASSRMARSSISVRHRRMHVSPTSPIWGRRSAATTARADRRAGSART